MGYLRKNEIKSEKRPLLLLPPHTFIHMTPFPEILDPPLLCCALCSLTTGTIYSLGVVKIKITYFHISTEDSQPEQASLHAEKLVTAK